MSTADKIRVTIPFLKWAGGKRWFIENYANLLPLDFSTYHEPFLGGGSVFFHLAPHKARLSDLNSELIETYAAIRDEPKKIHRRLLYHQRNHNHDHYYRIRTGVPGNRYAKAGDFIYLNRTCWNGIYRVNKEGRFNVPIGDRDSVQRDTDDFQAISNRLIDVDLQARCFSKSVKDVQEGDFCFIDPPYTVKHDHNGFLRYNESIFSWDHQVALRDEVARVASRGGQALVLNANHSSIWELYEGVGQIMPLSRRSNLAANSKFRGATKEVAIVVGYDV